MTKQSCSEDRTAINNNINNHTCCQNSQDQDQDF